MADPIPDAQARPAEDDEHRASFVDHLRTVHFSLVTTCFLLLVGAALSPSFEVANAHRGAREIADSYCGLEKLTAGIPVPTLQEQVQNNVLSRTPVFVIDSVAYSLNPRSPLTIPPDTTGTFDLRPSTRRALDIARPATSGARGMAKPLRVCDSTATMTDFANHWDALEQYSALMQVNGWDSTGTRVVPRDTNAIRHQGAAPGSGRPVYQVANRIESAAVVNDAGWTLLLTFAGRSAAPSGDTLQRVLPIRAIRIRLKVGPTRVDHQFNFINPRELPWRTGSFEKTFPELFEYYGDIGSLSLPALEQHMQKLRMQERQSIILFGAAIPADSLRTWGMFVLVVIQLYLFVHLVQFKDTWGKFLDDRSPWIGSDGSRIARLVYEASLTALPFLTMLVLTVSAVRYRLGGGQIGVLLTCVVLSTLLTLVSGWYVAQEKLPPRRKWVTGPPAAAAAEGAPPAEGA